MQQKAKVERKMSITSILVATVAWKGFSAHLQNHLSSFAVQEISRIPTINSRTQLSGEIGDSPDFADQSAADQSAADQSARLY